MGMGFIISSMISLEGLTDLSAMRGSSPYGADGKHVAEIAKKLFG